MRIADKMQFDQVKNNIGKNRSQMSELQNQAATQKRVNKPSDDPLAASRVLSNRVDLLGNKQYGKSLGYAKSFLEFTDQSLGELGEIMVRAKELAIGQSSDGASNEESRRVVATELEQLYNQMVAIGNRKLGDRFIFGGFHTQNTPFDEQGHYAGDNGEVMIHIDKETFLPMNVTGGRVFLGEGISADGMVKAGPQQAKSVEELEAQVQKETQAQHPEMKSTEPTKTDPGKSPEQSSDVNIRGPASVKSPLEEVSLANEPGGLNLFHLIKGLRVALASNDKGGVQNTLDDLDKALEQVVLTRSQVGSRGMVLDSYMQTNERQKVDNKVAISTLEDADIYATVSDINKTQSTLQATLETSGKLITPSLLQFLR